MNKQEILALLLALAAYLGGVFTHSIVGAGAAAALAALMFYCRFLAFDDKPTQVQQNILLVITIAALIVYVSDLMRFHWADWWSVVFSSAYYGYMGALIIMSIK